MRTGVTVDLSDADRQHLAAIVADRNSLQKHVWRARIVLLTADGCGTAEIMRRSSTSKTADWRWQERFMTAGGAGLLRDKTRPSRIPPLGTEVEQRVVARTLTDPPGETTHWTAGAMATDATFAFDPDVCFVNTPRLTDSKGIAMPAFSNSGV
jgi:hypothetical protein